MAITRSDLELAKKKSSSQLPTSSPGGSKQTTSAAFDPSIGNLLIRPEQSPPKAPKASPSSREGNHGDTNQSKPADEELELTPSRRRTQSNRTDTETPQRSQYESPSEDALEEDPNEDLAALLERVDASPFKTGEQLSNPAEGTITQSKEATEGRITEALVKAEVPSKEANMPPKKAQVPSKKSNMPAKKTEVPWSAGDDPSLKQYWLFKAEQEDRFETLKSGRQFNTKFTIDDLRSKTKPEPWDGVRNAVAAKNMRSMKKGDEGFFYASGGKAGRKPGITGIVEVVGEAEPDVTTADEDSYGYVEKESDRDRWCVVHVEFRKKLTGQVTLKELQRWAQGNGQLKDMQVLKTSRLSVSKVTKPEWDFIVDTLINGAYEDEDEDDAAAAAAAAEDTKKETEAMATAVATAPAGEDKEDKDLDDAPPSPISSAQLQTKKAKGKRRATEEAVEEKEKEGKEAQEPPRKSSRRSTRQGKR